MSFARCALCFQAVPACLIAAFVATNFESFLGATTQGKLPWLTNEVLFSLAGKAYMRFQLLTCHDSRCPDDRLGIVAAETKK